MTIDDQIRDEKLQYEAAKTSVLSSGKIDKYEYLTGEEILPSNQKQITEQAKITFYPLGKVFKKQIKTIENQGEKQIEAFKDLHKNIEKQIHKANDYENELPISREREIPKDIYNKRLDKTDELTKKIDYNDLNLIVNSTNSETDFSGVKDPITLLNDIKEKKITIKQAKTS